MKFTIYVDITDNQETKVSSEFEGSIKDLTKLWISGKENGVPGLTSIWQVSLEQIARGLGNHLKNNPKPSPEELGDEVMRLISKH